MRVFVFLLLLLLPSTAFGSHCTIRWAMVPDADLAGYRVYEVTPAGNVPVLHLNAPMAGNAGDVQVVIFNQDAAPVCGVGDSFVVTAVDTTGNEGLPSASAVIADGTPGTAGTVEGSFQQ